LDKVREDIGLTEWLLLNREKACEGRHLWSEKGLAVTGLRINELEGLLRESVCDVGFGCKVFET